MRILPEEETAAIIEHEERLQANAWEWADKGRLVAFVFALAERADPLADYRALMEDGLEDHAKNTVRRVAYMLEHFIEERGWDYEPEDEVPDDVIEEAGSLAHSLVDENYDLPWVTDEVLDHAQANADAIVTKWHEAADGVGAKRREHVDLL